MNIYVLLYIVYVICGLMGAIWLRKVGPRWLMFWSTIYVVYSSIPAVGMVIDSRPLHSPQLELVGQSLLVFFSVVGGALFASAWSELRHEARVSSGG